MQKLVFAVVVALSVISSVSFSQENADTKPGLPVFGVDSLVFATGIQSRSPVGAGTEFASTVDAISCWTRISSTEAPVSMKHIWYKDGIKVFEYALTLKSSSGRIWSTKSVSIGNWKVDIIDDTGARIKSGTFVVK